MAVVGYEVDQVQKTASGDDLPVPITWAYNHHYGAFLVNSKKATLTKSKGTTGRLGRGHGNAWISHMLDHDALMDSEIPLVQFFSEGKKPSKHCCRFSFRCFLFSSKVSLLFFCCPTGNGGEFRLSYHGYLKGYAQLIDSPDNFHISPMQIETWNREMNGTKFMSGPLPKNSRIPSSAGYSGLVECPCSDRLPKKWAMTYALDPQSPDASSPCTAPIENALECFSGARDVVKAARYRERTISDASFKPDGCSVETHSDGSAEVVWNSMKTTSSIRHGRSFSSVRGKNPESRPPDVIAAFGQAQVNVTVTLATGESDDASEEAVSITLVGPSDRWFAVGFGSSTMCNHMVSDECPDGGPYAIIVSGDGQDGVTERKLDYHGPGTVLGRSVAVKSSVAANGNRTVVLTRSLKDATVKHYTFDLSTTVPLPIITARGCDMVFAQHCGHGPTVLNFLKAETPTGVCQAGISGTIGGASFSNKNRCAPQPTGDLAVQHNPTCSVQGYRGGLSCCRDGQSLLDTDQDIPWPDEYLEYYLKFRFYFEEYQEAVAVSDNVAVVPASHEENLVRLYRTSEAFAGEYDIVGVGLAVCSSYYFSLEGAWHDAQLLHPS